MQNTILVEQLLYTIRAVTFWCYGLCWVNFVRIRFRLFKLYGSGSGYGSGFRNDFSIIMIQVWVLTRSYPIWIWCQLFLPIHFTRKSKNSTQKRNFNVSKNFWSIEWHQKHTSKSHEAIPFKYTHSRVSNYCNEIGCCHSSNNPPVSRG
jgi:hypothetical protein